MKHKGFGAGGYSLIEVVFTLALGVTVTAAAVPQYLSDLDDSRAAAATRYLSSRLQGARMEAVLRSTTVAMQFVPEGSGYGYAVYVDGNRNGVLTRDIARGIDSLIGASERLTDQFPGVEFGVLPGLPPVDAGGTAPGVDPIHLGSGSLASFSAAGTSTSGTLYLKSRGNAQYAVRIFGETGRTRMLKFDRSTRAWRAL